MEKYYGKAKTAKKTTAATAEEKTLLQVQQQQMAAAAFDKMLMGQTHSAPEQLIKMIHRPREKKSFEKLRGEEFQA